MRTKITAILLTVLIFLLCACSTASPTPADIAPTPSPSTTALPTPVTVSIPATNTPSPVPSITPAPTRTPQPTPTFYPLMVEGMRQRVYPGSEITVEKQLNPGSNYTQQIVSYRSEGLKIYALLTIPNGKPPASGWPVILFNHGYIPPKDYRTTERYVAYVDAIARSGYIVFKSDYRGHGSSEGQARGGYSVPDYTVDVLNGLASVKRLPYADPQRIGMWGHSMGGHITLRSMVTTQDVKVGVIWGGVVAPYADLLYNWHPTPPATLSSGATGWRGGFSAQFGTPEENPDFWAAISPSTYLKDLSGPLQLHHAEGDEEVPVAFSKNLFAQAQQAGLNVELYLYPGDNHNISANFALAMQRSIAFFDRYLK